MFNLPSGVACCPIAVFTVEKTYIGFGFLVKLAKSFRSKAGIIKHEHQHRAA
jgi:hypothetical protein